MLVCSTVLSDGTEIPAFVFWLQVLHCERPSPGHSLGGGELLFVQISKVMVAVACRSEDDSFHSFSWQLSVPVHLEI